MRSWSRVDRGRIRAAVCFGRRSRRIAPDKRRSGFDTMSPRIQSMQRDDLQNPGMLWVADGEVLWKKVFGISFSCAHCHDDAKQSMKGVAAKYPDWDPIEKRPVNLSQRINLCRTRHQLVLPLPPESVELLGLEAYVAHQSRGMPLAPSTAKELTEPRERGRKQYEQRIGQLNLSCAQCHDQLPGKSLAGSSIPRGARERLPDLPPRMARHGLVAAPPAQLPERRARRAAAVQLDRDGRTRAVPGAAQRRHEDRDARGQTLESGPEGPAGARRKPTRRRITRSSLPQLPPVRPLVAGPRTRKRRMP